MQRTLIQKEIVDFGLKQTRFAKTSRKLNYMLIISTFKYERSK